MLLSLESAIEDGVIDVFSHFEQAPHFFERFGVTVNRFQYFSSVDELGSLNLRGEHLPRRRYPKFTLPKAPIEPPSGKPVIGIHIEGSQFSNNAARSGGRAIKDMSRHFLENLIDLLNTKFAFPYVFCSPLRNEGINAIFKERYHHEFRVIAFEDVWASLACVAHCKSVLATDSAIKTMAAVLRIPSVVLAADYSDPFRDEVFLNPYVSDGLMRVIRFKDVDALNPCDVAEEI